MKEQALRVQTKQEHTAAQLGRFLTWGPISASIGGATRGVIEITVDDINPALP